jgi:hypothetical protein
MEPGEIVTTFNPWPGALGGTDEGATCVICIELWLGVGCEAAGVPATGALAGPVPEVGP